MQTASPGQIVSFFSGFAFGTIYEFNHRGRGPRLALHKSRKAFTKKKKKKIFFIFDHGAGNNPLQNLVVDLPRSKPITIFSVASALVVNEKANPNKLFPPPQNKFFVISSPCCAVKCPSPCTAPRRSFFLYKPSGWILGAPTSGTTYPNIFTGHGPVLEATTRFFYYSAFHRVYASHGLGLIGGPGIR